MTAFDAKTTKMTDTTSLRREALIEGGSSRERARLTVWSEDNPRDQLALVAICAWLNVKPDQLPSAWHGHTCEATKEAWARVAEAIKSELEADLARVTAERDAERAVADEWKPMSTAPKGEVGDNVGCREASVWFIGRVSEKYKLGRPPFIVIHRRAWPQDDNWACAGEAYYVPDFFDGWRPIEPDAALAAYAKHKEGRT